MSVSCSLDFTIAMPQSNSEGSLTESASAGAASPVPAEESVNAAALGGVTEVKPVQMAQIHAVASNAKAIGAHMVIDHSKANDELTSTDDNRKLAGHGNAPQRMKDTAALERFVDAQSGVYSDVLRELQSGKKQTHWMWFIFPQLRGLGTSENSLFFGLASADEAWTYLEHPLLGARLRECVQLVLSVASSRSVQQIFGSPDDLKLLSCLTLFGHVAPNDTLFQGALLRLFGGDRDHRTFELLGHED